METAEPKITPYLRFGTLLKHHRLAAGLSQEQLAERARVSVRAISAYELGQRTVRYRETEQLLAGALGLGAPEWAALEAAVPRQHGPQGAPARPGTLACLPQPFPAGRPMLTAGGANNQPPVDQ